MKYLKLTAAIAAASLASGAALAADPVFPAPIIDEALYDWTGLYIGAHVGYGWSTDSGGTSADGFLGGIQAGYNWQVAPQFVLGAEADIAWTGIESAFAITQDYVATVRGRLGFAVDSVLLYGTAGWAHTKLSSGWTGNGYAVGAGVEWAFAPGWSTKAEYLFHNFDADSGWAGSIETSTVKLGVNYHF